MPPRSSRACSTPRLRCPCWLSTEPFSCAMPALLRVGVIAVMGAESLVTAGLVEAGVVIEIAERGGEAVKAVFARHAAQAPQGVLQSDRQRGVALAAQHRLGMLPGGVGQHVSDTAGDRTAGRRC